MNSTRVLGLIPARGGSKGLPGKNLRPFCGKPLIKWTIDAARGSGLFEMVVVSTDDDAIAAVSVEAGAEVLMRPSALAEDTSPMMDVVMHALDTIEAASGQFTHVMLLQPTSPLRAAQDIRDAWGRLGETGGRAVVSVSPLGHSPLLANTLPDDGSMADFLTAEVARSNRQSLATYYRLNGAIYLAETRFLRDARVFVGPGTFALVMPEARGVDIDTDIDFRLAELIAAVPAERLG